MSSQPMPLFVDTAAFFARFNERTTEHERARSIFSGIRSGTLDYDPLYTSRQVLSELATLLLRKVGHRGAVEALRTVRTADSFNVLQLSTEAFERTCEQFSRYDDQHISFVDHSSSVLAAERDVEHVFTFDSDFRTFGFTLVPGDTGES